MSVQQAVAEGVLVIHKGTADDGKALTEEVNVIHMASAPRP